MQDIVIIPTFDRPEMLWFCLDYLAKSPDSKGVQIRVYIDAHVNQKAPPRAEIEEVLDKFPQLSIQTWFHQPHSFQGNSFNVISAYRDAYATDAQHVFLIEDDVIVRPEFFAWHRKKHEERSLGCSIGVMKERHHGPYASLGVCFRREMLALIVPHCRALYFQNMRTYIRAQFEAYHALNQVLEYEQDGLWARLLVGHQVVWAPTPLAQHVGWYGYHRHKSIRPCGTLTERYLQVKTVLQDIAMIKAWVKDFNDIQPLQTPCN